ncbi:MAG: glucose-6-phosphate dehydrogenase assembly protein OpcA [Terriglobales bacterium]
MKSSAGAEAVPVAPAWQEQPGIAGVERHWATLRGAAGEGEAAALTWNLLCRARDAADAERVEQWLWKLGPRHPARVFIAVPGEGAAHYRVAADRGGSELVEVRVAPERVPGLVTPLLAGDLPVLLLWHGPSPEANREFQAWAALADRVLVDGHHCGLTAVRLQQLASALPSRAQLNDLCWSRLTPWRQLVCQGLEAQPAAADQLAQVRIEGACELSAALFAGWLTRQLDWKPQQSTGPGLLRLRAGGRDRLLQLVHSADNRAPLHRIGLTSEDGQLTVTVEHRGAHVALSIHERGALVGHWAGPAADSELLRQDCDSLSEELSIQGHDTVFPQVLAGAAELMNCLETHAA